MQKDLPVLQKAGLEVAAISYDSAGVLKDFAARKHITYALLSDHESEVIRRYDVYDRRYRKGYQLDIDSETIHTSALGFIPVYGLAYPSVFVLDRTGKVEWRFVSEAAELRLTGRAILDESIPADADDDTVNLSAKPVKVAALSSNSTLTLGTRVLLGVALEMPKGVHVYAPSVDGEYIGVSWQMAPSKGCWDVADAEYPEPQWMDFAFAEKKLPVYESALRVSRELIVRTAIKPNDPDVYKGFREVCLDKESQLSASGVLKIQACNAKQCFPPQSIPLNWKFQFLPPDTERSPTDLWREFEP